MPQLTIRGISPERISMISKSLVEELALICECGTDNFTLDCIQTVSLFNGEGVGTYPFIEVAWFERGPETRDRVARSLTEHVRLAGVHELEIAFKVYSEDGYYINGTRCDLL
ncbi:DUF1904 family protein [Paenibacillus piri]|uniref:DUF1904 family protein n=1 Tax=Paenibacillus piri TaxID=2547395 RepID=A0A4R5KXB4_9BACL|nr:DUF1904 family protein [Paenibacillus piri]TDG00223.1 DUF1904 family protein [Paenibacillus piri]